MKNEEESKLVALGHRRWEDIKGIVAPEIGPKSFGTFEEQALGLKFEMGNLTNLISLCKLK